MQDSIRNDLSITLQSLKVFIPVVGCLIGYITFWFVQQSEKVNRKFLKNYGVDQGSYKFIVFTKYLGAISMGLLPLGTFLFVFPTTKLSQIGLGFYENTFLATISWIIGLSLVIIPIVSWNAKKSRNLIKYPQIRAYEWDKKMIYGNLLAWAIYLLGYELLFRGLLLFPLIEEIGFWPAVAINIGMYSGTHIAKGLEETIGAIILSIVLCLLCAQVGTIWIAFFVHLAMAWTNTLTSLKYNPNMKIVNRIKK